MPILRAVPLLAAGLALARGNRVVEGSAEAYEAFRQQHGRAKRGADTVSYLERFTLFEERRAKVDALNARPHATWVAGLNHLADYTEEERRALLGYRRMGHVQDRAAVSSFLEARPERQALESVDWRSKMKHSYGALDQGGCGSCWAVASVGALETHAEIWTGKSRKLSYEQLVDCVKNPRHCGGTGGCKGATAELAFAYVQKHGLIAAEHYKGYQQGGDGTCRQRTMAEAAGTITGWERLPENKVEPLKLAVSKHGPVVISVDASPWGEYQSGVFNGCGINATVNHAVLLVGYGHDASVYDPVVGKRGMDYWLIRNSWGPWGEGGFIRIQRFSSDEGEAGYCGVDSKPKEGVGCDGGKRAVPVCGMCGSLADSAFPVGVQTVSSNALDEA